MRSARWLGCATAAALVCACASSSGPGSGTSGKTIRLRTVAAVSGDITKPRVNALGFSVTLSKAVLSVGPLYYFQGDPVLSRRVPRGRGLGGWLSDVLERTAHAHPGHYVHGDAMGEMTTPSTVDLLAGTVTLGVGGGVSGMTDSARFSWQTPPVGDKAAALGGHVVLVEGVATKGADRVHFLAKADARDVLDGNGLAEVEGCTFGPVPGQVGVDMESDGTVTLTVAPSVWLDQVDFAYVLPGASAPDAVVDIAGTLAWQGFVRGVKKGTGYLFSYAKGVSP